MRNLSLAKTELLSLPNSNIAATAIDTDEQTIYIASERPNLDGVLEVEIWQVPQAKDASEGAEPRLWSMFSTTMTEDVSPQLVSLRILQENRRISCILRCGDITTLPLDDEDPMPEVEGTVEPGILAASWSPDESVVSVVTGEFKLILMTSTFDVLSEAPLETSDFGEDAPINVGWGSKQTQFHGSLGKAAAQAPSQTNIGSSPDDDNLPRISWRGDGAYFVVSSRGASSNHRVLRVYDRQAALQSTSEAVAGLEHPLSWRPSGNLIASTQRFGFEGGGAGKPERHDLVFFERNGLRHGEFGIRPTELGMSGTGKFDASALRLKWGYAAKEIKWSPDSNVLTLWLERDNEADLVQLWTIGNYHWYLKHEISAASLPSSSNASSPPRFTSVEWHPELSMHLILTTSTNLTQRSYIWETASSSSRPPNDSGLVAVQDGSSILLTPFRTQNVPPPMSSYQLSLAQMDMSPHSSRIPIHSAFSPISDSLAVLWETGYLEIWSLHTRLGTGSGPVLTPQKHFGQMIPVLANPGEAVSYRQVILVDESISSESKEHSTMKAVVLGTRGSADLVSVVTPNQKLETADTGHVSRVMQTSGGRLIPGSNAVLWQSPTGEIMQVNLTGEDGISTAVGSFPGFANHTFAVEGVLDQHRILFGLTDSGKLYVSSKNKPLLVSSNATSFSVASGYLIFTTNAHEATFAPLGTLPGLANEHESIKEIPSDWEKRRVERGSRIVVPVPSATSLVLQMPRGNLETINPRPLVMAVVRSDLDEGHYRKAFLACRKHRIDSNVLAEHDRAAFLKNIPAFVEQVHEVDYINLFLTNLGRGQLPPEDVSSLCDAIRLELEQQDLVQYINSILTARVVKTPPDYEGGLSLLLRLKAGNPELVEDAVKYIIFLVDANKLFDVALGMYDFSLVLTVAQHAQKDPREYLPFLRELRALEPNYQKFRIDDHLRRHAGALKHLHLAGPEKFAEAVAYIERHQLHSAALLIWKETERYKDILILYGEWLYERREFRQAAAVFIEADAFQQAMVAYEKSLDWQALFEIAFQIEMPSDDVVETGYRVADDLAAKKRYLDSARVLLDYCQDVRQAIVTLVQGNAFSEARRIISLKKVSEFLEQIVHPAALESRAQISEDIREMQEQLRKQLDRLRDLRVKRVEQPDEFYGVEDTALQNVDVMTDVSMPATAFTRYTIAPTSVSRKSKQSSRSKRKAERKVGSGKKGTVDEEEYLFKSVAKLAARFSATVEEARQLMPHLFQFSPEHRGEGLELQQELDAFSTEMNNALDWIWTKPSPDDPGAPLTDTWAARMTEVEKRRQIHPTEKVPKPEMLENDWRMKLLDLGLPR